jgi:hypothetical protein
MHREVPHKVRGEMRTDIQYYHRMIAVVIVSTPFQRPPRVANRGLRNRWLGGCRWIEPLAHWCHD